MDSSRLPWYIAGPALALLVVALQWTANLPLGASGAIASLPTRLRGKLASAETWRLYFFAGMVLGGLVFALATRGFAPTFTHVHFDALFSGNAGLKAATLAIAGLLIGFGSRTAGGCTSGNGICGFSRGSRASIVSTVVFVGVAVAAANLLRLVVAAK